MESKGIYSLSNYNRGKFPKWSDQYMVVWAGYALEENSCEPYEVLEVIAEKALKDYHSKYPRSPWDHRVEIGR